MHKYTERKNAVYAGVGLMGLSFMVRLKLVLIKVGYKDNRLRVVPVLRFLKEKVSTDDIFGIDVW